MNSCPTSNKLPLVAISGRSGCGNTTVGQKVAVRLGFEFVNYTFRQMAAERGCELAELARQARSDPQIDRLLDQRQIELAGDGPAVVSSRLAIWLLARAPLKVYLDASDTVRARRIHTREGGDLEQQRLATRERDRQDSRRYQQLYQIDNNDPSFATLILNSEQLNADQCADIIVASWRILVNSP